LLFNSMEPPVFSKFAALPVLIGQIASRFGIAVRMSGSGSACFALLNERTDAGPVEAAVRAAWGPSAFFVETRIA
jgi:4-diphosphocytidyl-2-C-methyl-D-erythritol kinase